MHSKFIDAARQDACHTQPYGYNRQMYKMEFLNSEHCRAGLSIEICGSSPIHILAAIYFSANYSISASDDPNK